MTVRRESVVLDLDDHLSPGMLRAAASTEILDQKLNHLDGQSVATSRGLSSVEGEASNLSRSLDGNGRSIDRYSGRLGVLLDAGLAIAPAFVTMAAVAVPAVAAIGSEVGFLGIGLGTTMLAVHGLGDALSKFNKAELQPTATNIAAAQQAMDKLPPSTRALVLELHQMMPLLDRLRQDAASGLAPGLVSFLHDIRDDAPLARDGLRGISSELGLLAREAGQSLSSDQWRPFLRFVGQEAPVTLDTMGRSVGHVAHGLAELWMAFDPVNDDIDSGILRLARDFDQWAASLGRTQGFEDFLDYVRENGPRVLDLLGQVALTGVHIGTALAPLGGPTIDILTHLLEVIDGIAQSDLGTPLFAGLVAFRLYARTMQVLGVQVETSWKGMAAAPGQVSAQTSKLAGSVRASSASIIADLRTMGAEYARTTRTIANPGVAGGSLFSKNPLGMVSTLRATENTTKGVGRFRSTVISALSGTSAAAERTRVRLGGLAKGGAVAAGLAVVATGAADKVGLANTSSLALAGSLAGPVGAAVGGAIGFTLDLAHANDNLVDSLHRVEQAYDGSGVQIDFNDQAAALANLNKTNADYQATIVDAWTPGGSHNPVTQVKQGLTAIGDLFTHTSLEGRAAAAQMASVGEGNRTAFGQIFEGLNGSSTGSGGQSMVLTTQQLQDAANRAQPAMLALGITVDDLNRAAAKGDGDLGALTSEIVTWINRADSAGARTHAVAEAFAQMGNDSLTTDQRVQALSASLDALLGPGLNVSAATDAWHKGLNDLNKDLHGTRIGLNDFSNAAIANKDVIRARVGDLSAMIKAEAAAGASPAKLTRTLKTQRQALIDAGAAAGINRQAMKALLDAYGLTPKLIKTAIQLAGAQAADNAINGLKSKLEGLDGRVFHTTIRVDRTGVSDVTATGGHVQRASGGTVPGQRYPYADRTLVMAAPGEEIITNRHGEADRFRSDRAAGRIPAYADGGTVTGAAAALTGDNGVSLGLRSLRHELALSKKALADERQARQSLVQREQALVDTVQNTFRSDVFSAQQGGVWMAGGGFDPFAGLQSDIDQARAFDKALHKAHNRGLSGGAFEALAGSGNVAGAQMLAGDTPSQLRRLDRLYRERQQLTHRVGEYAGQVRFGGAESLVADRIARLENRVRETNAHLKAIQHATAETGPRNTAAHLNNAAGHAARTVRRGP